MRAGFDTSGGSTRREAELRGVLDVDANFPWALETLGAVCAQQGNSEEALALTERAHVVTPWSYTVMGQLAALLDRVGDRKRVDALLETLGTGEGYGASTGLAIFHAMKGDPEQAAEWAARGIEQRFLPLVYMVAPLLTITTSVAGAGATDESAGLRWGRPALSLRRDLAGKRLRDDLAVSHDVRVGRHLVYVVGCLG